MSRSRNNACYASCICRRSFAADEEAFAFVSCRNQRLATSGTTVVLDINSTQLYSCVGDSAFPARWEPATRHSLGEMKSKLKRDLLELHTGGTGDEAFVREPRL